MGIVAGRRTGDIPRQSVDEEAAPPYYLKMISADVPAFRAWSFLTLTSTANGVLAYPDELDVRYVYDNNVPNGRKVKSGDLAVIRDNRRVLGAGWIDIIEITPGSKTRYRCPNCGSTNFKYRRIKQPAYFCSACDTGFATRVEEHLDVQVFTANYSRTFREVDRPFPIQALSSAYIAKSTQNAIRELDPSKSRLILEQYLVTGAPWWEAHVREDEKIPGGHGVGLSKTRVGQQQFREAMLERYGSACAFTGPQPPGALEAAHLYFYSKSPKHDTRGGLLLRRDLHALFDRWLITIDPDTWSVQIAPDLRQYPQLAALHGSSILVDEGLRPREEYIRDHSATAHAAWDHSEP